MKLSFSQNDPLMGESFWSKDCFITHILFELCVFRYLVQSTYFRDTLYVHARNLQEQVKLFVLTFHSLNKLQILSLQSRISKVFLDYLLEQFFLTIGKNNFGNKIPSQKKQDNENCLRASVFTMMVKIENPKNT